MSIVPGRPSSDLGAHPARVRLELPGTPVVGEHQLDDLGDPGPGLGVLDRDDGLDAPVEVAVHEVGRADVPLAVAAVLEAPDPRVLEELADDRADADPLGDAGHARLQRAGAADDEVDVDAGAARRGRAPR